MATARKRVKVLPADTKDRIPEDTAPDWQPPRGMRFYERPNRLRRYVVQWRVDGMKPTKAFEASADRLRFAKEMTGAAAEFGLAAYVLNPDEAFLHRSWKAQIPPGVTFDDLLACWFRHGVERTATSLSDAADAFIATKTDKGVTRASVLHYRGILAQLKGKMGNRDVRAVTGRELAEYIAGIKGARWTVRTHHKRITELFRWLKVHKMIEDDPSEALEAVKIVAEEVQTWTVEEFAALFEKNEGEPPELLGRLACECFAGLRFGSAAQLTGADFQDGGIVLPAAKIKTRRRQFIDGLPDNLWWWVRRSEPAAWQMDPRQYLEAKSRAVTRAGLRSVHNGCRHGFGTYAMSAWKDAAKVAAVLCHTNQKMLYQHYKGRATEAQGAAYFLIYPTGACPLPLNAHQTAH